ncbi:inverse autotransporter beta domain-containing protein [Rouxiella sp. T17]|uniref:inverse autotransporter beta domain-containing protein n=1 Tax=Rouxiella sp. T17 TaxID=3085684 RepID=UPI002FC70BAC
MESIIFRNGTFLNPAKISLGIIVALLCFQQASFQQANAAEKAISPENTVTSNDGPVKKDLSASSYASGVASQAASQQVENLLNKFGGSSRITLGTGLGSPHSAMAADLLIPLFDNQKENLFFTQLGFRRIDSRNTLNLGLGSRYFTDSWMLGANAFFDNDMTGKNRRWGLGAEWWTDNLRLSANGYRRITEWHTSRDGADLQERPANGWDIEAQSWLPAYPQIGGTLKYEKYYGQNVALISRNSLQSDPSALSAAINWTPVPLVTFEGEHRASMGGKADNRVSVMFNHSFGRSLSASLDPTQVAASRSLQGSRYELVSRNNRIVLDYRKQTLPGMTMAKKFSGTAGQRIKLGIEMTSTNTFKELRLEAPEFLKAKGEIINGKTKEAEIILPPFIENGINNYKLTAIAIDSNGKHSAPVEATITVYQGVEGVNAANKIKDLFLTADGNSETTFSVALVDKEGKAITGAQNKLTLQGVAGKDNNNLVTASRFRPSDSVDGTYFSTITAGNNAGTVTLIPSYDGKDLSGSDLTLTSALGLNNRVSRFESNIDVMAIGQEIDLHATVRDKEGKPVMKEKVVITNKSTGKTFTVITMSDGVADAIITGDVAGATTYTAQVGTGPILEKTITFSDAVISLGLSGDKNFAYLGQELSLNVLVKGIHNRPLKGKSVTVKSIGNTVPVTALIPISDKKGIASFEVSHSKEEDIQFIATVDGVTSNTIKIQFIKP